MTNKEIFENFGYSTPKSCEICGAKPAKLEPRFVYVVCEKHCHIPPTEIYNEQIKYLQNLYKKL